MTGDSTTITYTLTLFTEIFLAKTKTEDSSGEKYDRIRLRVIKCEEYNVI